MKIIKILEEGAISLSAKLSSIRFIKAISEGLGSLIAVTFIGAIFALVSALPIAPLQSFLTATGLKEACIFANQCTIGLLSIYTVIVIAKRYCTLCDANTTQGILLSMVSFLIVTPMMQAESGAGFSFQWLGASGLFVAILLTVFTCWVYAKTSKRKLGLQLPDSVPSGIATSFGSILPAFLTVLIAVCIRTVFAATSFGSIHGCMFDIIQTPLLALGGSFWGILLTVAMMHILWMLGVHGGMLVMTIMQPVLLALDSVNMQAFAQGEVMPNIVGVSFIYLYAAIGGAGCTLALNILMVWKAKSKQFKSLGKIAIVPSFLGMNEPLIYGCPITLNPILGIPFLACPLLMTMLAYGLTYIGVVPPSNGAAMSVFFFNGLVAGSWKIVLLSTAFLLLSMLIYYPFFKSQDRKAYEAECAILQKES